LQDAQQLGLQLQRHVSYFVQKYGAAVSLLKASDTLVDGAGEGPAYMSKQLGLEQVFGERAAANRHHGQAAARPRHV